MDMRVTYKKFLFGLFGMPATSLNIGQISLLMCAKDEIKCFN